MNKKFKMKSGNRDNNLNPPRPAQKLLMWFLRHDLAEEVQGDLEEKFYKTSKTKSQFRAKLNYWWQVVNYLRPFAFRRSTTQLINHPIMFRNYFTIAWRNIRLNPFYSFLNIGGLSAGLACAIIILMWISREFSYDKFNRDLDRTCQLMINQDLGDAIETSKLTPGPLSTDLKNNIPEIQYVARVSQGNQLLVNTGKDNLYESGIYADPELFRIFTFPAVEGDPVKALSDPGSVVISRETAEKWFGTDDVLGKVIRLNNSQDLKIAAIIEDIPEASSLKFDVAIPFRVYEKNNDLRWDVNVLQTWISLYSSADLVRVNRKIAKLIEPHLTGENVSLFAYPLREKHLFDRFKNGKPAGGHIYIVYMMSVLGLFILAIACINFMNLSTARSERRVREVGVRKVMGARRGVIMEQFLTEAVVMTFMALGLGLLIAWMLLPFFNVITRSHLEFNFSDFPFWPLLIVVLVTGLVAGSYPAVYLSRFQPVKVLKGASITGKGTSGFRKSLVTFQFFISVLLIMTTLAIVRQIRFAEDRPLGYDQAGIIEIPFKSGLGRRYDVIKNELAKLPGIESVSASAGNMARMAGGITGMEWPGKDPSHDFSVNANWVNYDWIKTTGLHLAEGRDFSPDFASDSTACLVNQTAVDWMGLKDPIGQVIGGNNHIIGVVKDFVFNDPTEMPGPLVVFLRRNDPGHMLIRVTGKADIQQCLTGIEKVFKADNPGYPFEYHFLTDVYQHGLSGIRSVRTVSGWFAILAIFIACLGLLGLSSFMAERRKKEIGIRKVMGASASHLAFSMTTDFLKPVLLSFVLAAPLAVWALNKLLNSMDYHTSLAWWIIVLPGIFILMLAAFTVGFQSMKAASINPVESLRPE